MNKIGFILLSLLVLFLAAYCSIQWLEGASNTALLEDIGRIRPHANLTEVIELLGPADYSFEVPHFPPWLQTSALGDEQEGTILVYTIKRFAPKLLIIHLLPDSGVQFVTWELT